MREKPPILSLKETNPFKTAIYWEGDVRPPPTDTRSDTYPIGKGLEGPRRNAELSNAETPLAGPPAAAERKRKWHSVLFIN